MIKRFIKKNSITVTEAINTYGESCNAVRTFAVNECSWISIQHIRLMMSKRYQDYLQMSDAHLTQIQIELEKRCKDLGHYDITPDLVDNSGNFMFEESIVTCSEIISEYGDLDICIPFPSDEKYHLAHDLIKYTGEYDWLMRHYKVIPFGKLLYSGLIDQMRDTFIGRVPGKQIWHTHKVVKL